jgi:hypothetical protein
MVHAGEYSEPRSHTAGQTGSDANFRVAASFLPTIRPEPRISLHSTTSARRLCPVPDKRFSNTDTLSHASPPVVT